MTLIEQYVPAAAAMPQAPASSPDAQGDGALRSVRVCLGRRWIAPEVVLQLQAGSIVELDCPSDCLAEVFADGRPAGRGSPVVVEGKLGIRMEKKES
jgi:hypothetical protein